MQQVVQDAMAGMSVQGHGEGGQDAGGAGHEAAEEGGAGGPEDGEDSGESPGGGVGVGVGGGGVQRVGCCWCQGDVVVVIAVTPRCVWCLVLLLMFSLLVASNSLLQQLLL